MMKRARWKLVGSLKLVKYGWQTAMDGNCRCSLEEVAEGLGVNGIAGNTYDSPVSRSGALPGHAGVAKPIPDKLRV